MGSFIGEPPASSLQLDGDQVGASFGSDSGVGAGFGEVGNADAAEQAGDAVVDTCQRVLNGAGVGEDAPVVTGSAGSDEERAIDGVNDFEGGDFARALEERVAAAH